MMDSNTTIKKDYLLLTIEEKLSLVLSVRQSRRTVKTSPIASMWQKTLAKLSREQLIELADKIGVGRENSNGHE